MIERATAAHYDAIGHGYAQIRRADPRLAAAILSALDGADSVVNVGAGTGSYEPRAGFVLAVEPSSTMIEQRPPDAEPAVKAVAEALPLPDDSVDAALAVLSIQHWVSVERGLSEMLRVARRRVVLITMDVDVVAGQWFIRDYFPETLAAHAAGFPPIEWLLGVLPGSSSVPIPVPLDCTDGFMAAFWGRPEAYLDPSVRLASSAWHQIPQRAVEEGVARLREDLARGDWDDRYGSLRRKRSHDVGLRLVCADLSSS